MRVAAVFHRSISEFLARRSWVPGMTIGQVFASGLAGLVVAYGAVLRFDAITLKYGPVDRPAWLRTLQESRGPHSVLRPEGVTWEPVPTYPHRDGPPTHYLSDPYTYLQYAREARSFFAAHRREPLFPFATRVFLLLLHGQDVAVSFASASFSVLAIIGTLLLGWYVFSFWVGVTAALAMAIEYDVISWGVGGWRDDAFTAAVIFFALAVVRYYRVPSRWNAVLVGVAGGMSCLIRITSMSFLLPGFGCLVVVREHPWGERLGRAGLAALVATAIVAPFIISCWLAFGDPLYAIDVHADIYRAAEGQTVQASQTAAQYLLGQVRSRPMRTLDTVVLGLTSYPFLNKWRGFDPWFPLAGKSLSWAAVLGVVLFVGLPAGRLLLIVLATSLVPYALTWRLISDWRFTEHAYPFFLVAACFAIGQTARMASPSRLHDLIARRAGTRRVILWGIVLGALGVGVWAVTRLFPVLVIQESLRANEAVTIMAGDRDASFFVEGWSPPRTEGNVTARVSQGDHSTVRIPLPRAQDYDLVVRQDPYPRPLGGGSAGLSSVRIFVNGRMVGIRDLRWTPGRVGAYEIRVPGSATRKGFNRIVFQADAKPGGSARFSLWYLLVRPAS